jgi:hemerythrin-like domain-containing protein
MEKPTGNLPRPDIFANVHKGLRKALFDLAALAGATDAQDAEGLTRLTAMARDVFRFAEHHAFNEDRFLIPRMVSKGMPEAQAMQRDHQGLESLLHALGDTAASLAQNPGNLRSFYLDLNRFIAQYLLHLDEEETRVLPSVHAHFTDAELGEFGREAVASTSPQDQDMMLSFMFPAMTQAEVNGFFENLRGKAPAEAIAHLQGIARRAGRAVG